jgi:hypothetical protein
LRFQIGNRVIYPEENLGNERVIDMFIDPMVGDETTYLTKTKVRYINMMLHINSVQEGQLNMRDKRSWGRSQTV